MIEFKEGRQPHDPWPQRLLMDDFRSAPPAPPAKVDWVSGVRVWPMLGNDDAGDCTAAGAGHVAQQVNWYGRDADAPVTTADTLGMYSAISGYRPGDPGTDVGATLQAALDYWRKTGIGGNRIAAFAQVDVTDLAMVRQCIATFGSVYAGMWITQTAMDQFNAAKPWVKAKRSKNLGGHCVPILAYDADSFTCVTWAKAQPMTVAFFQGAFDECWVPIDLDWLRTTGVSPAGLDTAGLNAGFTALTGAAGPFPAAPVTPVPPKADPADAALAAAFDVWRRKRGV